MPDEPATKADIEALKLDLTALEHETKADIEALKLELLERLEKTETRLLTEFRKWAVPMNSRTKVFESTALSLMERLTMVEERLTELETNRS